jgi:hypothetical protein
MLGFKKNNSGSDCDAIVREIAERCSATILSQLTTADEMSVGMSIAQLRGYVRAHAWPQVLAEAKRSEASGHPTNSNANDLAARVLEQTVHLVTRVYLSSPIVATPAPHISRRAA